MSQAIINQASAQPLSVTKMNHTERYKLTRSPLCEEDIRHHLHHQGLVDVCNVTVLSSVSSTNDFLLEREFDGEQFAVCVAEKQTEGRGRYGHQWVSPASANLYLSMSWPLQGLSMQSGKTSKLDALSLWLLMAIAELMEQQGCVGVQLKWPNDLCVQDKKLAGILIERKVGPARANLVIGVGINVAMHLNEAAAIEAPWIDLLTIQPGWQLSRNELAAKVVAVFYETLKKLEANQLRDLSVKWGVYDMLLNKKVEFLQDGVIKTGYVKGIDDLGLIVLGIDAESECEHLHSAHISEIKIIGNKK